MKPRELQFVQTPTGALRPPADSGIDLAIDDTGVRITLPHRITTVEVAGPCLAALTAVWIGAGVIVAVSDDDPLPATVLLLFVLVGLGFAAVAATVARAQALRTIEDRGDATHLIRSVRGRPTRAIIVAKDRIRSIDRPDAGNASGSVRIHTDTATFRIGCRLTRHELDWLEAAVREIVSLSGPRTRAS